MTSEIISWAWSILSKLYMYMFFEEIERSLYSIEIDKKKKKKK